MKNLFLVISFIASSVGFTAPKDLCFDVARAGAAGHVRAQDYFKHFDPHHPGRAAIRSVKVETNDIGFSYVVSVAYGLPGEENNDVEEIAACYVETLKTSSSHCKLVDVSCDVQ